MSVHIVIPPAALMALRQHAEALGNPQAWTQRTCLSPEIRERIERNNIIRRAASLAHWICAVTPVNPSYEDACWLVQMAQEALDGGTDHIHGMIRGTVPMDTLVMVATGKVGA